MTDYPTPKFPATPEEVKAASEKVVNFWVGALSPMWVPFWAASGFGLSAWAMTQSLSKSEGLLKDMPQMADMAGKWPGFWAVSRPDAAAETVDTVEKTADAAVEAPAVLKAKAPKVEPKPIARAVSAARKPAKKA